MQLILAWAAFPLVLAALGAGWGALVEKAAGREVPGALLVPLGLLAVLVTAALLTASEATAPAAVAVTCAGGVAGLAIGRPWHRLSRWPLIAAAGVLLAYGAPVLLTGEATFAGYNTLDDTASWLGITDQLFAHGRAVEQAPSTYQHVLNMYLHLTGYPAGGFMLLGVGQGVVGIDAAWVLQPYLAICGALLALALYALLEPLVPSNPGRAGLAAIAAQPALLYGFSLWGSIKELTVTWALVAGIALAVPYVGRHARVPPPRETLFLVLPAAALVDVLGAGAAIWIAPALLALAASWTWAARDRERRHALAASAGTLVAATVLFALPALLLMSTFLATDDVLFAAPTGRAQDIDALGGLLAPLSLFQIAGIWPIGDFRLTAPTAPTVVLVAVVATCVVGALVVTVRRGQTALALFVATAVLGVVAVELAGSSPWVVGKALAIGAPAFVAAALVGAALLFERSRVAGGVACALIAGGVLWSNALAYHDTRIAPRPRLAELQHVGDLIAGKGPTLFNEYDVYGSRHLLGAGDPTTPAELRDVALALGNGARLGAEAHADLDAFGVGTLYAYRTIVTSRSPTQSRPPSGYRRVWQGRWYEVWQRPKVPTELPVVHVPGGDSTPLPYCGRADQGDRPLCSVDPAAIPPCTVVRQLRRIATRARGRVVGYQRASPIVTRADAAKVPRGWTVDRRRGRVVPTQPGTARFRVRLPAAQRYGVWLGGTFARSVEVSVDGRRLGSVRDPRQSFRQHEYVATTRLGRGEHTFEIVYPRGGLGPGGGRERDTVLMTLALEPLDRTPARMISVAPAQATSLCHRSLDWIEVVAPRGGR